MWRKLEQKNGYKCIVGKLRIIIQNLVRGKIVNFISHLPNRKLSFHPETDWMKKKINCLHSNISFGTVWVWTMNNVLLRRCCLAILVIHQLYGLWNMNIQTSESIRNSENIITATEFEKQFQFFFFAECYGCKITVWYIVKKNLNTLTISTRLSWIRYA